MFEYYLEIRMVHITSIILSGSLYFLRGLAMQLFESPLGMAASVRYLSYTIDTVLLTSALMLMVTIGQYPFVDSWLTVKVLLVIAYIVLGAYGLKYGRTERVRVLCWAGALAVFGFIVTVARAHHPLGIFA